MTVNDALRALKANKVIRVQYIEALKTMVDAIAELSMYGNYDGGLYAWLDGLEYESSDTTTSLTEQWDEHVYDILPCYREPDEDGWQCVNDRTSCLWNDGHNTCNHPHPISLEPLVDEEREAEHGN
jgi:hypothetical protein